MNVEAGREGNAHVNQKRLQSLIGKLVHLANGIEHARKFTGSMLATLRTLTDSSWFTISEEAILIIEWFTQYASTGNGISLFSPDSDYLYIKCDASLTGAGANFEQDYYIWKFDPKHVLKYPSIHMLEAINLLVSYKTLAPTSHPRKLTVVLLTDNIASFYALTSEKTKDPVPGACACQMWLEAARCKQHFIIQHKPGSDIPLADALSRYHDDPAKARLADQEVVKQGLNFVHPVLHGYTFFYTFFPDNL